MSREVELGWTSWTSQFCFELSKLVVNSSATDIVFVTLSKHSSWNSNCPITLPLFWRRSTVSPVFFGRFPRSSLHSVVPSHSVSVPLISHLASVDVKQQWRRNKTNNNNKTRKKHSKSAKTFGERGKECYHVPPRQALELFPISSSPSAHAQSTVSPVFFGRFPRSSLHSVVPSHSVSVPLISHLASVDVKQQWRRNKTNNNNKTRKKHSKSAKTFGERGKECYHVPPRQALELFPISSSPSAHAQSAPPPHHAPPPQPSPGTAVTQRLRAGSPLPLDLKT